MDAIVGQTTYRIDDLATDPRWPEYVSRAAEEVGLAGMLPVRLAAGWKVSAAG
ncbi:MAG: hypothetical protein ABJA87_04015 [bacterium]